MTFQPEIHSSQNAGLSQILQIWRRRRWIGIPVFLAVLAVGTGIALSLPNLYVATVTVLVERQQVSEEFVKSSVSDELETRIQTIHQQVMSRARLSDLIERLGLYAHTEPSSPLDRLADRLGLENRIGTSRAQASPVNPGAYVDRMRKDVQLNVKGIEQTSGHTATISFDLTYSGRDPKTVAEVTNALATYYMAENTKKREEQATDTATFLKDQLANVKTELDDREKRVNAFKSGHTDVLQPVEVNLTGLERLTTQLRMNTETQLRIMERRQTLQQQLTDLEAGGTGAAAAAATPTAQLAKLKQELVGLRQRYSDQYPDVIHKKAEVDELEAQVAASGPNADVALVPPPKASVKMLQDSIAEVNRQLAALKQEEASLRTLTANYESRVEGGPKRQQQLQELSRDYDSVNERYQVLAKRFEEARLAENLEEGSNTEQFRVLDPALPPTGPTAPNRLYLLIATLVGAIALGVAAVIGAEKLDDTFHSVDELRAFTNLPALGTIPRLNTRQRDSHRIRQTALALAVALGVVVLFVGSYEFGTGNEQIVRLMTRPGA